MIWWFYHYWLIFLDVKNAWLWGAMDFINARWPAFVMIVCIGLLYLQVMKIVRRVKTIEMDARTKDMLMRVLGRMNGE